TLDRHDTYSGHFDIVQSDGSIIPVESGQENNLYCAIIRATDHRPGEDIKEKAAKLRHDMKLQIQHNLEKYSDVLKLQIGYEEFYKTGAKYTKAGVAKRSQTEGLQTREGGYLQSIALLKDCSIARTYRLGFVDKYKCLKNQQRWERTNNSDANTDRNRSHFDYNGAVKAEHIPAKDAVKKALRMVKEHSEIGENLRKKNPKLHKMMESVETDPNGENLLAMEVLTDHQRLALTSGSSKESKQCRDLLCGSIFNGDVEKMIKQSIILAHPVTSQSLRKDA
ncbi:hypothetical protein GJAV_G00214280, partial [Gymnothorax javanicus]